MLSQVVLEGSQEGWVEVGHVADLDDDRRIRVLADDHDIALFRCGDDVLAIANRCPHAGGPLSEGCVYGDVVVCPLHAWKFDLRSGLSPDVPGASVRTYEVRVEEDGRILLDLG